MPCLKKHYTWLLIITSANVDQFTKILSLSDSWENLVHTRHKDSPPHLKYVSTLPCETEDHNCPWFQWHVKPQKWGCLNSSGLNPMTIKSVKQCSSLRKGSMVSANWSSGWLTCNLGCSRQSLMKLAPVNGVNVCKLVFYQRWTFSAHNLF